MRLARDASLKLAATLQSRWLWANARKERGDMPGWVLIAVMTAGLVAAIWLIARQAIKGLVEDALSDFR